MSTIMWLTMIACAVFGALLGFALARNGVVGHGIGNNFGKHHMQNIGESDNKDTTPDRWDR